MIKNKNLKNKNLKNNKMTNKNFTFPLGVSKNGYSVKPTKYNFIPYEKKKITIEEFSELVLSGHIFCHNYKNYSEFNVKEKTSENFHHTNLIWIDFDKSSLTYSQAYEAALIKPTMSYTTMSNTEEENRFRFIYLFKEQICSNEEYTKRANLLMNIIFNKDTFDMIIDSVDKSGFRTSQQFLGTKQDCLHNLNSENIVSIEYLNDYLNKHELNKNSTDDNNQLHCFSLLETSKTINDVTYYSNSTIGNVSNVIAFQCYNDFYNNVKMIDFIDCHKSNNIEDIKKKEEHL